MGAGKIGSAIAYALHEKQLIIDYWDIVPGKVKDQKPLEKVVPRADVVFLCTPSWSIREATSMIKPLLKPKAVIVSPSKGLEQKTGLRTDEIFKESLPEQPCALLLGSMLADEILNGGFGIGALACADKAATDTLVELFKDSLIRMHPTTDVAGAAWAGVLKNVYAMLMGIAHGLEYGDNVKGFLAARALREMRWLIEYFGGHDETCLSAAGAGDFLSTGYSPLSRNRQLGHAIVHHEEYPKTAEGIVALPLLLAKLGEEKKKYPALLALEAIVLNKANPRSSIDLLTTHHA